MSSSARKLTQPLRPAARYRKGQAPANLPLSDSDEEAQADLAEQQVDEESEEEDVKPRIAARPAGGMKVSLREVEVDQAGQVRVGGRTEVGRTAEESSQGEYETDEDDLQPTGARAGLNVTGAAEESSSEYETDSEEEAPKPIYKPVFVSKRNRDTLAERAKELDPDALEAKRMEEAEERKKISHDLVAASITRELAAKDVTDQTLTVDDTDGLDPGAEFDEWKLRELMRIKRDKDAQYAREKEREEVEARRALPEALRLKEDTERADASRKNKQKGQQVFGQKYHHKGAFYADADILKKHDYSAPSASTVRNMESLPAAMQNRNFGKASQSKYTHLAKEDTSREGGGGAGWDRKSGGGGGSGAGCFNCGGAHLKRDCPQAGGAPGPSGSNGSSFGPRDGPGPERPRDSGYAPRPPPSFRPAETREGGASRDPPPSRVGVDYGGDEARRGADRRDEPDRYGSPRRDENHRRSGDVGQRYDEGRYGSSRRDDRERERRPQEQEPDWRNRGAAYDDRRDSEGGGRYGDSRRRSRSPGRGGGERSARDRPPHDDKRRRVD